MKTNQKYFLLSLVTVITVAGMSMGAFSFAQVAPAPLTCSVPSASINTNQAEILTASGAGGTYVWSGASVSATNSATNQIVVVYPTAGVYAVNVTSAGQTATCNVTVFGTSTSGSLSCAPAVQNVIVGQTASLTASGGSSTYTWASPDLTIINPNGSGFSATYGTTGFKTLSVTSGGLTATCVVNVLPGTTIPVVVTPGLPNTGGGFGK